MAEHRVPNDSIVVRGGKLEIRDVREQADDEFRRCGTFSISAVTDPGKTFDEVARAGQRPNVYVRKTTAGRLRVWGFDVAPPTGTKRHANLILAKQRSVETNDWAVLDSVFDPPEFNPFQRAS